MVNLSAFLNIRADFLSEPERMLFSAVILFVILAVAKLTMPLLNGWTAFISNAVLALVALLLVFGIAWTWNELAIYLCIVLMAAGIHGTITKLADYPSPDENPTPSGTPRQNYGKIG